MSAVSDDDLDMLWNYYLEVGMTSESVILVGNVNIPKRVNLLVLYWRMRLHPGITTAQLAKRMEIDRWKIRSLGDW